MEAQTNGGDSVAAAENGHALVVTLRLLCPHSLVPALIGKKGENVKRIRRESGATLSVAEPVMGCDERVVHITGESIEAAASSSAADALCAVFSSMCSMQPLRRGEARSAATASTPAASPPPASPKSAAGGEEERPSANGSVADGGDEAIPSSAASTAAGEHVAGSANGSYAGSARPAVAEARLLVDSSVVGFLVGRGGSTIKDTMQRSGAGVRILPKPELPACACVGDEVVRVVGSCEAVCAALRLLAGQCKSHMLRHGPPPPSPTYIAGDAAMPRFMMDPMGPAEMPYYHPSLAHAAGYYPPGVPPGALPPLPAYSGAAVEVTFRLLVPTNRTGNIIGKGGEHVRRVRTETGARIKVFDPAPGSEERVVAVTSTEDAMSPYCAAQDALIRCVVALAADDSPNTSHRVRLLTAQASVGMVLGKRGATVSQLRQETGASIKVLNADSVPAAFGGCIGSDDSEVELGSISSGGGSSGGGGLPNGTTATTSSGMSGSGEEVVQLEGLVQQVVTALRGVATLLRGWQVRRMAAAQQHHHLTGPGMTAGAASAAMMQQQAAMAQQQQPLSPTYSGMLSPSTPSMLGFNLPSSLSPPVQQPFMVMHGMHGGQQQPGMMAPGVMSPPLGYKQRGATYVYHLSNAQVGAVLGKGGAHIAQIRSMSGARVQLQGEGDGGGRVLMVAGLPEQCHAAHNMANAFLNMGRCDYAFPEPVLNG